MNDALGKLPPLARVIDEHGLRAKRALGQNFILDLKTYLFASVNIPLDKL